MRRSSILIGLAVATTATSAFARKPQRHFEPDDLELEQPGVLELNLQYGAVRGPDAWRLVAPDVEIDVGLTPNVEFDIDGAFALEAPPDGSFGPDHSAPDNVWLSMKLGLFDDHDDAVSWALGVQLGPKLPIARDAHGLGYEAIGLLARTTPQTQIVFQGGGFIDPGAAIGSGRPIAVEAGVDVELDFDAQKTWALLGEAGAVVYATGEPAEVTATLGPAWQIFRTTQLSLVGLVGLPPGSDRYGVLFGIQQKIPLGGQGKPEARARRVFGTR